MCMTPQNTGAAGLAMRSRHREAGGRSWRACCHLGRHRRGPERLPSTRGAVLSRAALQEVPDQDLLSGSGAGVRAGDGVQPRGVRPGGHWAPSPGARGSGKSQLPHTGASRSMIPGPTQPFPTAPRPGEGDQPAAQALAHGRADGALSPPPLAAPAPGRALSRGGLPRSAPALAPSPHSDPAQAREAGVSRRTCLCPPWARASLCCPPASDWVLPWSRGGLAVPSSPRLSDGLLPGARGAVLLTQQER